MTECVSCAKFKWCDLSSPNVNDCADYKEQMTNEEWFESLSTEEKADLLFGTFYLAGRNDEKIGDWKGVDTIVEWLKQPHTTIKE